MFEINSIDFLWEAQKLGGNNQPLRNFFSLCKSTYILVKYWRVQGAQSREHKLLSVYFISQKRWKGSCQSKFFWLFFLKSFSVIFHPFSTFFLKLCIFSFFFLLVNSVFDQSKGRREVAWDVYQYRSDWQQKPRINYFPKNSGEFSPIFK